MTELTKKRAFEIANRYAWSHGQPFANAVDAYGDPEYRDVAMVKMCDEFGPFAMLVKGDEVVEDELDVEDWDRNFKKGIALRAK